MKKVQEGLFLVEEKMPCGPLDIRVHNLVDTLGSTKDEAAASRVLAFSQELDQWVGVTWPKFAEGMNNDLKKWSTGGTKDMSLGDSILHLFGPQTIVNSIHTLIGKGMLHRVSDGEGENLVDVVFPTPALVSHIMQKQGVATS